MVRGCTPQTHGAAVGWPPIAPAGCTGPGWMTPGAPENTHPLCIPSTLPTPRTPRTSQEQTTYLATGLVVVAVHCGAGIWPVLPRICKLSRHHAAKLDVLAAATPLPALAWRALVAAAAATYGRGALGTRACHSEGHAGRGNGVHEG